METHTEIAVSPEDDLEIRRITLTNRSGQARRVVLTSYFEAVAGLAAPDQLHRVFSNLFVQTELEPQKHAVLVTRRPRSGNEKPAWVFCLLMASGDAVGLCSFETDRERFLGRGRTPRQPQALDDRSALPDLEEQTGPGGVRTRLIAPSHTGSRRLHRSYLCRSI